MSHRIRGASAFALSMALVVAVGACGGDDTTESTTTTAAPVALAFDEAAVTRADGRLTITWDAEASAAGAPVRVAWGTSPDAIDEELAAIADGDELVVDDPSPGERAYFRLTAGDDAAAGVTVAERQLPLEGTGNFRDLGGYATADGRRVKWGLLYRSGELGKLTDADLEYVDSLGIKLVCDLRSEGEIALLADRVPDGVDTVLIPIADDRIDAAKLRTQVIGGDLTGIGPDLLVDANRSFVRDFAEEFSLLMERVMDPEQRPSLTHCTAGKDRAGFASAVILWTLGVPTETVLADYLATNDYRAAENESALQAVGAIVEDVEPLRAVLEARREYLQAAIDAIDEDYGSIDAYLREGLGISDAERAKFQAELLEP